MVSGSRPSTITVWRRISGSLSTLRPDEMRVAFDGTQAVEVGVGPGVALGGLVFRRDDPDRALVDLADVRQVQTSSCAGSTPKLITAWSGMSRGTECDFQTRPPAKSAAWRRSWPAEASSRRQARRAARGTAGAVARALTPPWAISFVQRRVVLNEVELVEVERRLSGVDRTNAT